MYPPSSSPLTTRTVLSVHLWRSGGGGGLLVRRGRRLHALSSPARRRSARYGGTTATTTTKNTTALTQRTLSSTSTSPSTATRNILHNNISNSNTRKSLWQLYQNSLDRRPLLTKAVMAAVIFFVSDSATQYVTATTTTTAAIDDEQNEQQDTDTDDDSSTITTTTWQWDAARALSGAGFGVVATSWLHYWWGFLELGVGRFLLPSKYKLANALTKVAIDQLLGAPFYIYSYYVITNCLQDVLQPPPLKQDDPTTTSSTSSTSLLQQSLANNHTKASEMLWSTMLQHWKLWPAVHSFNFYYVPLHHRVLVQNCVLVGWSAYLSHLNHADTTTDVTSTTTADASQPPLPQHTDQLMTPNEEIKVTIIRRETALRLQREQAAAAAAKQSPQVEKRKA